MYVFALGSVVDEKDTSMKLLDTIKIKELVDNLKTEMRVDNFFW